MRLLLSLLLLTLLVACAETPELGDCKLTPVTKMSLQRRGGLLITQVGINGQWARMIVDTGAERTTLSTQAAERLKLGRDLNRVMRSVGVGGASQNADAVVDGVVLGGVRFPLERVAVGTLNMGDTADGLLGADVLLAFEMDIDVPENLVTLYRVRRCLDARPSWTEPYLEITGVSARKDRLLVPFELDGASGTAIVDTGAEATVIGVQMARRMGLTEQSMSMDRVVHLRGAGAGTATARLHWFRQLRIGPAVRQGLMLTVMPTDVGVGDALIGQDFLRDRRVWMSFPTRRFFVSRLAHEITPPVRPQP